MIASASIENAMAGNAGPVRTGVFVVVVGASGAGKDTLIAGARARFGPADDILFVERVVTRPSDDASERHRSMSPAEFDAAEAAGAFAVCWRAHGLRYGIPATVDEHLRAGHVAVANGSRAALPRFAERYSNLLIVHVTAAPEVLAERLAVRGRESRAVIAARLRRADEQSVDPALGRVLTIDNSGPVETAVSELVAALRRAVALAAISHTL